MFLRISLKATLKTIRPNNQFYLLKVVSGLCHLLAVDSMQSALLLFFCIFRPYFFVLDTGEFIFDLLSALHQQMGKDSATLVLWSWLLLLIYIAYFICIFQEFSMQFSSTVFLLLFIHHLQPIIYFILHPLPKLGELEVVK